MRPKPSVSWNPESVSLVLTADNADPDGGICGGYGRGGEHDVYEHGDLGGAVA